MSRRGWIIVGVIGALVLGLVVLLASFGAFQTPEDLDRRAAGLDGPERAADSSAPNGDAPAEGEKDEPSLAVSGHAAFSLHNFSLNDKEGRNVLSAKKLTGSVDISALKKGTFRMTKAKAQGVKVTLYRDDTGKMSVVHAFSQQPPHVRAAMVMPPKTEPEHGPWLMDIGPVEVEDATLKLGFTKKPVVFHVDTTRVNVRRRPGDEGPMIYIEDVQGHMTKPHPLPKPVRIAWANGVVQLAGTPMVHLVARACIGVSTLRVDAVVPARKEPVQLTVDSSGIGGALGRMGMKIAARHKKKKMSYKHGAVKIGGGPRCSDDEMSMSEVEGLPELTPDGMKSIGAKHKEHDSAKSEAKQEKHKEHQAQKKAHQEHEAQKKQEHKEHQEQKKREHKEHKKEHHP